MTLLQEFTTRRLLIVFLPIITIAQPGKSHDQITQRQKGRYADLRHICLFYIVKGLYSLGSTRTNDLICSVYNRYFAVSFNFFGCQFDTITQV